MFSIRNLMAVGLFIACSRWLALGTRRRYRRHYRHRLRRVRSRRFRRQG